jgi:radical SAM superfamily enzyme YgiQ (UPF0313 family)
MNILLLTLPTDASKAKERFFHCQTKKTIGFTSSNTIIESLPSFSLLYLSPLLKAAGHHVFYMEGNHFATLCDIIRVIQSCGIGIVGITSLGCTWGNTKIASRILKQNFPEIKIFVGGRYPSAAREMSLEEAPWLDGIIYGEGEYTLLEIVNRIQKSESLHGIRGSIIKESGKLLINPPREYIQDLDSLPFPDREIISQNNYIPPSATYKKLPHTYIYCSRGCTYNCIYCDTEKQLRVRSPRNIVDEIEFCKNNYFISDFTLLDNAFSVYENRAYEISEEILRRNLDILWSTELRVDRTDKKKLHIMKKSGCWKILYGIESGVQKHLDFLQKQITVEETQAAVDMAKQEGLEVMGSFMFGIPGETYRDGIQTLKFARRLNLDYASFSNITPFPNTVLAIKNSNLGRVIKNAAFDLSGVTFVPFSMSYGELKKLLRLSTITFYFRYRLIMSKIKRIHSFKDLLRFGRGFIRVLRRIITLL